MNNNKLVNHLLLLLIILGFGACGIPSITQRAESRKVPNEFLDSGDTTTAANLNWKEYFNDQYLTVLIDSALVKNQELNISLQEMVIAQNEIRVRKGEYLPTVGFNAGGGVEKTARYTPLGANEATTDIKPGAEMPEPVPDLLGGFSATWEVDVWKKLRNAKKSAVANYLASVEGKNFVVTNLIAEIANSYYELLALDNELDIVKRNIKIQSDAFEVVKQQKNAAKVTELAVKRFEAQLLKTKSMQYAVQQNIIETENRINFLVGRFPQKIERDFTSFNTIKADYVSAGIPLQLLENRPDIKQAELQLEAAKLDVKVAKAQFYPTLGISGGIGFQAYKASLLTKSPESMLYSLTADVMAPLVNRNAIKANYKSANAQQIQAVYNFERTVLLAYLEVVNQLSRLENMTSSVDLKKQEVAALDRSVTISNELFRSARADYFEVLLTQREALDSKFELIETKAKQLGARVDLYKALGGGWK